MADLDGLINWSLIRSLCECPKALKSEQGGSGNDNRQSCPGLDNETAVNLRLTNPEDSIYMKYTDRVGNGGQTVCTWQRSRE